MSFGLQWPYYQLLTFQQLPESDVDACWTLLREGALRSYKFIYIWLG
jgi:hypothetical protein